MSFVEKARQVGELLDEKNKQYGDAFKQTGEFLRLMYPKGIQPADMDHALLLVRIFDKMKRIASPNRKTDAESPYEDIAGYGILGTVVWKEEHETTRLKS